MDAQGSRRGLLLLATAIVVGLGVLGVLVTSQPGSDRPAATIVARATETVAAPSPSATATPIPSTTPTRTPTAKPAGAIESLAAVPSPNLRPVADLEQALIPERRAALSQHPDAALYRIGARLDDGRRMIFGRERAQLTNAEGAPLGEVCFRLYANAPFFGTGGIVVGDVQLDDRPIDFSLEDDDTVLSIALPQALQPGQALEVSLNFTTSVPTSGGGYGILRAAPGVFALTHWHPELAPHEDGACLLPPPSDQGDMHNTDAANYLVTFVAPGDYQVVTSGVEIDRGEWPAAGSRHVAHDIAAPLTRNFVVVAGDRFESATQAAGSTGVVSWYRRGHDAGGESALAAAARSIELFNRQFGLYPYTEFDVMEIDLSGAAGVEATGLIMIGSDLYDPLLTDLGSGLGVFGIEEEVDALAFVVAHEAAHQWWYSLIGNDAYAQPWLDESLTNWSAAFYIDETSGLPAGALARDLFIRLPYLSVLSVSDQRLDQPVDRFDGQGYAAIVYGKGALMYDVLRAQLGDAPFFEFLRRYAQTYEFRRADGDAWRETLAQVAGPDVAEAFYRRWVESDDIQEADLPPGGPISELLKDPDLRELFPPLFE